MVVFTLLDSVLECSQVFFLQIVIIMLNLPVVQTDALTLTHI